MTDPARPAVHHRVPFPAESIDGLLATAARAPSILNSQPWLFRVGGYAIDLYADTSRKLRSDRSGREMLISCGAALFGLRLAIRALGYEPVVGILPDPENPSLLARVRLGEQVPPTEAERRIIEAIPHRHTHRGTFTDAPLPRGLLIRLQHDAVVERAALAIIDRPVAYNQLADIMNRTAGHLSRDEQARADVFRWVRMPGSTARDGVPVSAIAASGAQRPGRLVQRDMDLGRGAGELTEDGPLPAATAVLLTPADTRADWLRAGQALHRLLAHAASQWVFASLYTQPLESEPARAAIRTRLGLPGAPQVVLQLGVARTTRATARRPAGSIRACRVG
ncbi:MAG TPA: hypothetical protein VF843_14995 [Streptosporangiaceae bacterium]